MAMEAEVDFPGWTLCPLPFCGLFAKVGSFSFRNVFAAHATNGKGLNMAMLVEWKLLIDSATFTRCPD